MKNFAASHFFDLSAFPYASVFHDENPVWEALSFLEIYIQKQFDDGVLKPNYKDRKNVYVGEGSVIHENAEIVGPAIIGKNCVLSHASFLRDGCLLGNDVHVGHGVELKHSILLNNAVAAHLNYIGDSIIGNKVNISGGAITANFRLDKKAIIIHSEEEKIGTNMKKLGAIIGDNSVIGVNAVINPGTLLGKNVVVYPLLSVKGIHQDGEVIRK